MSELFLKVLKWATAIIFQENVLSVTVHLQPPFYLTPQVADADFTQVNTEQTVEQTPKKHRVNTAMCIPIQKTDM